VLTETQLHGQTGETGQDYRRPELPATTTSTSPATNTVAAVRFITKRLEQTQLHDQANTRAKSLVATPSTTSAENDVLSTIELLEQTHLHDQTNTQPESPVATTSTSPATDPELSAAELLNHTHLYDQTNTKAESLVAIPSTTPAADAALSTTELLEQILSYFDIKDLVLLRRVSRHWSDVMAESLVLQRAMFLAPEPELPFKWYLKNGAYGEPHRYTKEQSSIMLELEPEARSFESSRFNPLLFERRSDTATDTPNEPYYPYRSHRIYPHHSLKDIDSDKLFSRMLIAQPPVTQARVGCSTMVSNIYGVRVSDMVHAMKVESDFVCRSGHVLSIVGLYVMFPTSEEEKDGQIIRPHVAFIVDCTDALPDGKRLRVVIPDDTFESGYSVIPP
jgi:hypothetical protein